ncbi:MAG: phytanoyl-CoA dioxygenase family protein [Flavisolibacter sp.]
MLHLIKRIKFIYTLYNFFHKKSLKHNLPLYKKHGIHKSYYSSISSKNFKGLNTNQPDTKKTEENIIEIKNEGLINAEDAKSLLRFHEQGYAILRQFYSPNKTDAVNKEIDQLVHTKKVKFKYGNKIMFAFKKSDVICEMANDARLKKILTALIQTEPILFQSINFLNGSEQRTHSDSIHMTTFPLGKLIAVWIALEDISTENGPLHYYPQSHLLNYYLNSDFNNEGNSWLLGSKSYDDYEKMIQDKIEQSHLTKQLFLAKKGDLLIWHANLFHGGEMHMDKSKTRKSIVFHYFGNDAICYHEITQRPALMDVN